MTRSAKVSDKRKGKNMKKIISVLLICAAAVSLCVIAAAALADGQKLSATPLKDESRHLTALMEGFAENLQPGTAGSSLKAAKEAVRLMDWGMVTKMTEAEIKETVEAFFDGKDSEFIEDYTMKLEQLDETCQLLLTDGQEDFLTSAGCTDTAYPWGGKPIAAVETFFGLVGLRAASDESEFPA